VTYDIFRVRAVTATEAEGYWYGSNYGHGITVFEMRPARTTSKDEIAFGFMTWADDGKLLRVEGDPSSGHFIEAELVFVTSLATFEKSNQISIHDIM